MIILLDLFLQILVNIIFLQILVNILFLLASFFLHLHQCMVVDGNKRLEHTLEEDQNLMVDTGLQGHMEEDLSKFTFLVKDLALNILGP